MLFPIRNEAFLVLFCVYMKENLKQYISILYMQKLKKKRKKRCPSNEKLGLCLPKHMT